MRHRTSPWHDGTNTPAVMCPQCFSYPSLTQNDFACMEWCKFIQSGFSGTWTDNSYFWGSNTFIWPCWGRIRGQNRTQFDSYYGRLACSTFWNNIHLKWLRCSSLKLPKCQGTLLMQGPPQYCSDLHHTAAETLNPHGGNAACKVPWPTAERGFISLISSSLKKISRRDIQQQVGFRKQCTNGLLFSLRIRHTACWGFGEFLHTSISRCLRSLVSVFQGSVLGTSPALTRTKERRLQSLTRGRMPAVLVRPQGSDLPLSLCATQHTGIKAGVLTWRQRCTRRVLPVDFMGLFQSRIHIFKAIKRWIHNEAKETKKSYLQTAAVTHPPPFHTRLKKQPYLCPCARV